jgi:hypothetical protein
VSGPLYAAIAAALAEEGWTVDAHEADGWIGVPIDGSTARFLLAVQALEEPGQVVVYGLVPPLVPEEQRTEAALLVARMNRGMILGNFELDLDDGELRFKASVEPGDAPLDRSLLRPLLSVAAAMTDRYLPAIEAVNSGTAADEAIRLVESGG